MTIIFKLALQFLDAGHIAGLDESYVLGRRGFTKVKRPRQRNQAIFIVGILPSVAAELKTAAQLWVSRLHLFIESMLDEKAIAKVDQPKGPLASKH